MEYVITGLSNVDSNDYPDFCDTLVSRALWSETKVPLTHSELDTLNSSEEIRARIISYIDQTWENSLNE